MSLKAKLEAVIYAAEEPVTLAQLAGLFADDALELKAEQEAAAQAQAVEPAAAEDVSLPFQNDSLPDPELRRMGRAGKQSPRMRKSVRRSAARGGDDVGCLPGRG